MIVTRNANPWRKRFALLPIVLGDGPTERVIWLEWVWKRSGGYFTEVSTTDPAMIELAKGVREQ